MAISPKSRGLGNIGSIVNRQGMASPTRATRPQPKPAPKLAPAPTSRNPFVGGKTTTMAQRQAMSPFKSATKPVNKIDPMQAQYDQMKNVPMAPPPGGVKAMPFNPQPTPGQPNPFDDAMFRPIPKVYDESNSPVFGQMPTPGQQPFSFDNQMFNPVPYDQGNLPGMGGQQGGGIFGGNLPGMVGNAVGQGLGGMFGNLGIMPGMGGQQALQQGIQGGLGQLFGNMFGNQPQPGIQGPGPAPGFDFDGNVSMPNPNDFPGITPGIQPGQMFGNPNPMSSDYDELEGSKFNTNPSMGGSLFGGGGFSGY